MPYDAAKDPYADLSSNNLRALEAPTMEKAAALSDTVDEAIYAKGFYVTGAGDVKYLPTNNDDASPITKACAANSYHHVMVRRIFAAGVGSTTATGIILQYDPL